MAFSTAPPSTHWTNIHSTVMTLHSSRGGTPSNRLLCFLDAHANVFVIVLNWSEI